MKNIREKQINVEKVSLIDKKIYFFVETVIVFL
jgi:hypothetical protein